MKNFTLLAIFVLILTACGPSNNVRLLTPPPLSEAALPAPNAPSVSVVNFTDARADPYAIGKRRDGSAFTSSGDVPLWISRAIADELARKGFRITFAMTAQQARSSAPDYIVTGKVNEVWLNEPSATEMSSQMRVHCALANRKGIVWNETCTVTQSKAGLPSDSFANDLLLDTLRDLVKSVGQKITQTIDAKK